jgi:hypothetical protein
MDNATGRPAPRTGTRISGYCSLPYGHASCSPGPVMYGRHEIVRRHCYCPCHEKAADE